MAGALQSDEPKVVLGSGEISADRIVAMYHGAKAEVDAGWRVIDRLGYSDRVFDRITQQTLMFRRALQIADAYGMH